MSSDMLFFVAIVLMVLALAVFGVAAVMYLRSQGGGAAPRAPQAPPQQPVRSPPQAAAPRVQAPTPPPAPAGMPSDGDYADEEMPTVIVNQPAAVQRPDAGGMPQGGAGRRTAGATIIAFDDEDDD